MHTRHLDSMDERSSGHLSHGVNHVLGVAIDEYYHKPRLYNCVKDVKDIIAILLSNYAFAQENVRELYDKCATVDNIIVALDDYSKNLNKDDRLILLFSGHGQLHNGIGFWIPVDAQKFTQYLAVSTIRDYLEPIKV